MLEGRIQVRQEVWPREAYRPWGSAAEAPRYLQLHVVAGEAAEKFRWHSHYWLCALQKCSKTRTGKSA